MVRPPPKLESDDDVAPRLSTYNPVRIAFHKLVAFLFPPSTALTIASLLVPLLVCLSLIPLIIFFSLFSGWYIWKNIPVGWQVPIYLQYGDGPLPYAELSLPPLSTTQPYDVSLQLALPASEPNFALGNFMVTLSLSNSYNKTLVTISRPAIALPPAHGSFSFSPRLIDLDVPLLSSYIPETSEMNARVDLGRRDGWKSLGNGEGRELSVWNAALRGTIIRHGIRGLVSRFPITLAFFASATFFFVSVIILAACILPAVHLPVPTDQILSATELKEERPARIRKRPRKNVAGVASSVHKSEDIPVDIPSAHTPEGSTLKRRRSRMSDVLDSEN